MAASSTDTCPSGSRQILNDKQLPPRSLTIMTSVPLSPPKQMNVSLAKNKLSSNKNKQMEHYVLQTIKGESHAGGDNINFVLKDNDDGQHEGLSGPSGEITEELHLSGDDEADSGTEKTQEIVEHVCGKCYKSFRRFNGLKKHLDFCRFDSGYHLRKAEMIKNLEKIEKDGIVMENKDICFCCGESYDTFHLGHINCPDCPKSFKTQISYERHIFITHSEQDDFPCYICNAKLRSKNLWKLHVDQHKNRGKPFACKICGKDFTRSYHLKRHQKYSLCSADENDAMHCKVCNKVYFRLDNLRAHLKHHLGTRTTKKSEYMCPICKNCFYSLSTLNIHTRTHTGERPFDCDLCEKKFPSLVALKKHRRYHTGEKPYTCSVCNQCFAVKEVLNRHMKRHTGERPHVCSECGKSFIQATQLKNHIKTHNRPFTCEECEEGFKTEKQLQRHAKTHKSAKRKRKAPEFQCTKCSASFGEEQLLADHMKADEHTDKQPAKRTRRTRAKSNQRTDCAICEKNFDTVKSLQFHILKVHEVDPEDFVNEKNDTEDKTYKFGSPIAYKIEEISPQRKETVLSTNKNTPNVITDDGGLVLHEFIIDELPNTADKETYLQKDGFTVIPLESNGVIEHLTTDTMPLQFTTDNKKNNTKKKGTRKTLAESLAAAIADDDDNDESNVNLSEEDIQLKNNVGKLLDMLVDNATLLKFGWPQTTEESVLCQVIENCGHDLTKDTSSYKDCDYSTRMREYVKLLFTVVIHNESIKELLNNYPIDEVIEYVLGNDDDDSDDDDEDAKVDNNATDNKIDIDIDHAFDDN